MHVIAIIWKNWEVCDLFVSFYNNFNIDGLDIEIGGLVRASVMIGTPLSAISKILNIKSRVFDVKYLFESLSFAVAFESWSTINLLIEYTLSKFEGYD